MINGVSLEDLKDLIDHPQPTNLTKILSIPGLYRILMGKPSIVEFIPLMEWLAQRATTVLLELSVETESVPRCSVTTSDSDWKTVSCISFLMLDMAHALLR